MKFLIDTNRYSDFAKGHKEIVDLFASADGICVPYVVLAELRAGFRCGTVARQNEQVLTKFLENKRVKVLYADDMTTQCYADIYSQLRAQGTPIPTNDIWIAALAMQHSLPLCSRDEHFNHLKQIARI